MSHNSTEPVRHDEGAILCAIIGGAVGGLLAYQAVRVTRIDLIIEPLGTYIRDFSLGIAVAMLIAVVGIVLGGVIGYRLGRLMTSWLAPQVERTILNTADKAARHRRGGDRR